MTITIEDWVSFISNSNKCTPSHSGASSLNSLAQPCSSSQCSCAAGLWASLTAHFPSPPLFIRLSWSDARLFETSPAPGLPRCVDGPWASPWAGRPLRPPLSCCDEMPSSQRPIKHSSQTNLRYQAPHHSVAEAVAEGGWGGRRRWRVLKAATSNNSHTNLGIGEFE